MASAREVTNKNESLVPYADTGKRLAALLVDVLLLGVAVFLLFSLGSWMVPSESGQDALVLTLQIIFVATFLVWSAYLIAMECSKRQATLGKMLLGIQVVTLAGGRLSPLRALTRNLVKLPFLFLAPIVFLAADFSPRRQTWHDRLVGGVVVRKGFSAEALQQPLPPRSASRTLKVLLWILAVLFLLGLVGFALELIRGKSRVSDRLNFPVPAFAPAAQTDRQIALSIRLVCPNEQDPPRDKGAYLSYVHESSGRLCVLHGDHLTVDDFQSAGVAFHPDLGIPYLELRFTERGKQRLATLTQAQLGQRMAVVLNDAVLIDATIQTPIGSGLLQISGIGDFLVATELAARIRAVLQRRDELCCANR